MNVDIKEISSCKKQISATLKPEDVKKTYNEVFNMFKAQVKISGFRQGKAPEAMIKSRYKKEIEDEVGKKLLNESVPKMLKDKGIEPISASLVNDININLDESVFSFEMEVEVNPVIELKDYKKIIRKVSENTIIDKEKYKNF